MAELLKKFDAYPKTLEDFRTKTLSGAAVSMIAGIFIVFLFVSEFTYYLSTDVEHELVVDTSFGEKLQINIDITFPRMPCGFLSIDAMDVSGEHQLDVAHNIFKKRLDLNGKALSGYEKDELARDKPTVNITDVPDDMPADYCGSCYGAEANPGDCCNTCEQVREAYRTKGWAFVNPDGIEQCVREGFTEKLREQVDEGCNLSGHLKVNKVAGNFHIAPGKSFQQQSMHVHDIQVFQVPYFNMTHRINRLSFGRNYPGIVNPLDGVTKTVEKPISTMFQLFLKVVPTVYERSDGRTIKTNQFSVTEHKKEINHAAGGHGLPGVFFMYDLTPMVVNIRESHKPFAHFITGVCAIIGGVFTVAGIVDSFLYHGLRTLEKKVELGKAG